MALPLPNLDDRSYADLVEKAISQIPLEYPEWTDHNPSDTGIILIELLAWLTEMTLYQVNQIPDENYASFVSLLKGEQWNLPDVSPQEKHQNLQAAIQETLLELRDRYRAVTTDDYEQLVLEDWNKTQNSTGLKIARVKCLPQRNLENNNADLFAKGHISLVVVPEKNSPENGGNNQPEKYKPLLNFLDERKLLTTRLHIIEPEYISITIEADLIIKDGSKPEEIKNQAETEVQLFFATLNSGKYWEGKGWHFGRSVYISEIYKLLDDLEGVDYVENLQIIDNDREQDNNLKSEITLQDYQLVNLQEEHIKFTILVQFGNERKAI